MISHLNTVTSLMSDGSGAGRSVDGQEGEGPPRRFNGRQCTRCRRAAEQVQCSLAVGASFWVSAHAALSVGAAVSAFVWEAARLAVRQRMSLAVGLLPGRLAGYQSLAGGVFS